MAELRKEFPAGSDKVGVPYAHVVEADVYKCKLTGQTFEVPPGEVPVSSPWGGDVEYKRQRWSEPIRPK